MLLHHKVFALIQIIVIWLQIVHSTIVLFIQKYVLNSRLIFRGFTIPTASLKSKNLWEFLVMCCLCESLMSLYNVHNRCDTNMHTYNYAAKYKISNKATQLFKKHWHMYTQLHRSPCRTERDVAKSTVRNSSFSKQTESNTQRNVPNTVSEEANKWRYFHSNLGNCKRTLRDHSYLVLSCTSVLIASAILSRATPSTATTRQKKHFIKNLSIKHRNA